MSVAALIPLVVDVGLWILDRIATRGMAVVRRMLHNSCRRIKRRIQRLDARRLRDRLRTDRGARIQRRIALHRWRLAARRKLLALFVQQPHGKWARHAAEMANMCLDHGNTRTGAPYPWEARN